jgi:hypothetical protein
VALLTRRPLNVTSHDDAVIFAYRLDTHESVTLVEGGAAGAYLRSGHLLYARGTSFFVVRFDSARLKVMGAPVEVIRGGVLNEDSGSAALAVSDNGVLAYAPGGPMQDENGEVIAISHSGALHALSPNPRYFDEPAVSPDGQNLATTVRAANDAYGCSIARAASSPASPSPAETIRPHLDRRRLARDLFPLPPHPQPVLASTVAPKNASPPATPYSPPIPPVPTANSSSSPIGPASTAIFMSCPSTVLTLRARSAPRASMNSTECSLPTANGWPLSPMRAATMRCTSSLSTAKVCAASTTKENPK